MSEAKPTPGPWTTARALTPTDGEFDFAIGAMIDGKKYCIAETFGRVSTGIRTPAEANACLIAAAPDLLEALRVLADEAEGFNVSGVYFAEPSMGHKGIELARAAIAKATGGAA